jgi:hypothetical protein
MNNANAIPAHGEHYFSQSCRADVVLCAHVTTKLGLSAVKKELSRRQASGAFFVPRMGKMASIAKVWLQQFVGHCA